MKSLSMFRRKKGFFAAIFTLGMATSMFGNASSHREAPFIATMPRVDATDFYMFRSYEEGREDFVTLIANYYPLQDAFGGPNYFDLEPDARYEILIDNDGDAKEEFIFRFQFKDILAKLSVPVDGVDVEVPLKNIGEIGPTAKDVANLNARQTFSVDFIRGDRNRGRRHAVRSTEGKRNFLKPADNIGNKSIPDYEAYAQDHIVDVNIPNCGPGRVFVGQRRESFAVNLGEIFDLVNLDLVADLLGPEDQGLNIIEDKNVTTIALEVPISCLTRSEDEPVIGGWTASTIPQARLVNNFKPGKKSAVGASKEAGSFVQVSRLGMPLVNEVVIGLSEKDRFNNSVPRDDAQFATFVTNPTLPELINILFLQDARDALGNQDIPTIAPTNFPRQDLITTFLTGFPGLNQLANVRASEMLRLNTAIAPTAAADQNKFGVVVGDLAGFPNGRRPVDEVTDISLRVAMGALCHPIDLDGDGEATDDLGLCAPEDAVAGNLPLVDGATNDIDDFVEAFPYLNTPVAGSPNPQR